jgi:D-amino-acid dehydrogenase
VTKQVVVIGAGIIGLCAAHYCAQRGFRVTVIDRHGEQRDGCTYGNTGMIVPSHFIPLAAPGAIRIALRWMLDPGAPFHVKPRASAELIDWALRFWKAATRERVARAAPVLRDLHMASRACYDELAGSENPFGLRPNGSFVLCKTHEALEEEARVAEYGRELGIAAEVLDMVSTAAMEPSVRVDVAGSVFFRDDATVDPGRLVDFLQHDLERRAVTFRWNSEVDGFAALGRRLRAIRCGRDEIEADEVVLAAGSWSAGVARELQLRIPLQPGKGYSLTLPNARALPVRSAILAEARIAVSPIGNALRVGGTMELAGFDAGTSALRVGRILDALPRYYPDFKPADFEGIEAWHGFRPCSPDGLPYIGRSASWANLIVATGHAMMGISLGPITGRMASEIVAGERPSIDSALLSPDRYQ